MSVEIQLPSTLRALFPGIERRQTVDAATVTEALDALDERHPGLRDRLCEPGPKLRPHIHVYVDGERAGVETRVEEGSRLTVIAAISGG